MERDAVDGVHLRLRLGAVVLSVAAEREVLSQAGLLSEVVDRAAALDRTDGEAGLVGEDRDAPGLVLQRRVHGHLLLNLWAHGVRDDFLPCQGNDEDIPPVKSRGEEQSDELEEKWQSTRTQRILSSSLRSLLIVLLMLLMLLTLT